MMLRTVGYPVWLLGLACLMAGNAQAKAGGTMRSQDMGWRIGAGAVGMDEELKDAGKRAEGWFGASRPEPPFSFTYGGRPSADLLRVWKLERSRKTGKDRTRYVVTYTDPVSSLVCRCTAIRFKDYPAVEWLLEFENTGTADTAILEDIRALDLEVQAGGSDPVVGHSLGDSNSADSFKPVDDRLKPDSSITLAPTGGRSSDPHLPFFNLSWRTGGMVIAVGWSGQWEASFGRTGDGPVRVQAGMQTTHLLLHPGETIRTPRILLIFLGNDGATGGNLLRQVLLAHYMPRRNGQPVMSPICASVNWTDPDGSYEGTHLQVIPALAKRGIEVFWSDMDPQQWYPGGFPNGTGTWDVDPAKYPHGLKPIGDAVRKAGLEYLLWFEPERVHPGTKIDKEHPEWVMKPEGEWSGLFRLHDPKARAWLLDYIDKTISEARLGWVRWDFNIEPLGFWRRNDPPDRQGMTEIRHIEGLYAMWDELRRRHPGLVIDNCASGGRRIDLETCTRGLPLWHSDMQCSGPNPVGDQLQNDGLFRWIPMHGCGNFGLEPSYFFRSAMTAGNILVAGNAEGRLSTADPDTEDAVKQTVAIYKRIRPYMVGDFYPLFHRSDSQEVWFGYQFHRRDLDAGVAIFFRREKSPDPAAMLSIHMDDRSARYEIEYEDTGEKKIVAGSAGIKVNVPTAPGSAIIFYRRLK